MLWCWTCMKTSHMRGARCRCVCIKHFFFFDQSKRDPVMLDLYEDLAYAWRSLQVRMC